MAPLSLGKCALPHGLALAPMAGVTDTTFRSICHRYGAAYTVSEMISAKALCYEQKGRKGTPTRTAELAAIRPEDGPMMLQLFGAEPSFMAEAAGLLESGCYRGAVRGPKPLAIDINMGCPVPKVVKNGEGSALMREPKLAAAIVTAVKKAVSLPVTVKIRAGWDDSSKNAVEFAKAMEAAGADLVTVHGRTRQQLYQPGVDLKIIAAVKAALKIPVLGNGDLFTAADALHMLTVTGVDGLMIARGALGNPFLFAEITAALEGRAYTPPTVRERLAVALAHAREMEARLGACIGIPEARKHMGWYSKGLRGSAAARNHLMRAESADEIAVIFETLLREEQENP